MATWKASAKHVAAWLAPGYPSLGLKELKKVAAMFGATVEGQTVGVQAVYNVEAPTNNVWAGTGTHALAVYWRTDEPGYRTAAVRDAIERMQDGLAKCDDEECDYCNPI